MFFIVYIIFAIFFCIEVIFLIKEQPDIVLIL